METRLHSFMDIFDCAFESETGPVTIQKIVIPMIQRDYAQGRRNPEVDRVRKRFLESLADAVSGRPIALDFIYGDIDERGVMTPLDGQQRLTTLFLLHWYAAKKEKAPEEEWGFLRNFSYETRYSARDFCMELTAFAPSFQGRISDEIINQTWFPLDWKKDPTIRSMLVVLDEMDERFREIGDIWGSLKRNAVTFYFLPIKDMGLTDELYIRMNSRGKPLTRFEHFKAELERDIKAVDGAAAERIMAKIDREWTDLLWRYCDKENAAPDDAVPDEAFLRYFNFICDMLCYKKGESPQGRSGDELDLLQRYFSGDPVEAAENIRIMEDCFDCWCTTAGYASAADFLTNVMSHRHERGKIVVESRYQIDIFGDCIRLYLDRNRFPLNRFVLFYAATYYLRNADTVTHGEFARRIRIVNNLIQNSADEVSDRIDRNRIPAILAQTEAVIMTGTTDDSIENSFNVNQIQEEKDKIEFLAQNPERAQELYELEDHPMLRGQIAILGLENLDLKERFESLFSCGWDWIDRALMSIGDYGQQERNKWRYQYASRSWQLAWDELFHKSANSGFDRTSQILVELLSGHESFDDKILEGIVNAFLTECEQKKEYPWRYYYVKYDVFRPGSYGKLSNACADTKPYLFSVMQTRSQWSQNTYMPYLKAADEAHLSKDDMGQRLVYGDRYIECENDSYLVKTDDGKVVDTIPIEQNEEGVDTQDRIVKLKNYIRWEMTP